MEDLQPQDIEALAAHVQGLEAALDALGSDASAATSLRRLARSLASAAQAAGQRQLYVRAQSLLELENRELPEAARALLGDLRGAPNAAPTEHPALVLIVEDNRTVATAVRAYLDAPGRTLLVAETADEAETILASEPIDLIVLDLILPDRDGRDLLLQIREQPDTATVPVVVLSAKGGTVARAECLAVGASEFLEKPADPKRLRAAVSRHIAVRRRSADRTRDRGTGLLNRAGIIDAHGTGEAHHAGTCVAILAVNELSDVFEILGRQSADDLVRCVASEIRASLGEGDMIGRWSASELVVLLPGKGKDEAKTMLKQSLSRLARDDGLSPWQARGVDVSFSAGVIHSGDRDVRAAVVAAEQSMYRARDSGTGVSLEADEAAPDHPPRILLVEDDRVTATLIHHRLVRAGFEVMDFLNGEDAYEWASQSAFDLAILDVKVPGMDGFELLERLRSIERLAAIPMVMLTGLGREADVIRGLQLGASDYMLKPFSPTELLARIRRLLHSRGTPGADAPAPGKPAAEAGAH